MKAVRAGVDTWSVAWQVEPKSVAEHAIEGLATVPSARGVRLPEKVNGYVVGYFPGSRLAFAEGHPFGRQGSLTPPKELRHAFDDLVGNLADVGIHFDGGKRRGRWRPPPGEGAIRSGFAGVRRLDLTADLAFDRGAEGLAVLAGIAAFPMPRLQTAVRKQPGGTAIETIAFFGSGGRRMLGRWYDKGVEANLAPRGELIRPEDQRRFSGGDRFPVEALSPDLCRQMFQRRFLPLWKATEGVIVGGMLRLVERVGELVEADELTDAQAKAVVGRLALDAGGVEVQAYRTRARERALARRLGLVLADAWEEVEVDLHAAIEAALEAEDWYAEG